MQHKECGSTYNEKPLGTIGYVFSDGRGIYQIISGGFREELYQEIQDNKLASNLDKLDELKKLNEEGNPVIFYYEFKDAE